MSQAHVIFLDNYDSFTYNLVEQCRTLGYPVTIYRNTVPQAIIQQKIDDTEKPILLLSPGPGHPTEAGCLLSLIQANQGKLPILGICLGHQALIHANGGKIGGANRIVHGKASSMHHTQHAIFSEFPNPMNVARYHSLTAIDVPNDFEIIAESEGTIMAVTHQIDRLCGLQFHPESLLTTQGAKLLAQTLIWLTQPLSL
jgi:anthranilate synthase component 2